LQVLLHVCQLAAECCGHDANYGLGGACRCSELAHLGRDLRPLDFGKCHGLARRAVLGLDLDCAEAGLFGRVALCRLGTKALHELLADGLELAPHCKRLARPQLPCRLETEPRVRPTQTDNSGTQRKGVLEAQLACGPRQQRAQPVALCLFLHTGRQLMKHFAGARDGQSETVLRHAAAHHTLAV
jgi:hypothetical protein